MCDLCTHGCRVSPLRVEGDQPFNKHLRDYTTVPCSGESLLSNMQRASEHGRGPGHCSWPLRGPGGRNGQVKGDPQCVGHVHGRGEGRGHEGQAGDGETERMEKDRVIPDR